MGNEARQVQLLLQQNTGLRHCHSIWYIYLQASVTQMGGPAGPTPCCTKHLSKSCTMPFLCVNEQRLSGTIGLLTRQMQLPGVGWCYMWLVVLVVHSDTTQSAVWTIHRSACSSSSFLVISLIRRLFRFTSWNLLE